LQKKIFPKRSRAPYSNLKAETKLGAAVTLLLVVAVVKTTKQNNKITIRDY
jgi:hypothetical protein